MRKKCCYSQRNLGSICCGQFRLQLTSHTQPFHKPFATFSNKVWEVYFSKELSLFVHYCWLCFRIYMYTYSCITAIQHFSHFQFSLNLFPNSWGLFPGQQIWLMSLSSSWTISFSALRQGEGIYLFIGFVICWIRSFH